MRPRDAIPRAWKKFVLLPRREVERPAYTLCILEELQIKLRRHDRYGVQIGAYSRNEYVVPPQDLSSPAWSC